MRRQTTNRDGCLAQWRDSYSLLVATCAAQTPALYTKWENFTTANGMPDAKVFSVAVDGDRVWAGTENGLVLIENGKSRQGVHNGRWTAEPRRHRHRRRQENRRSLALHLRRAQPILWRRISQL